MPTSEPSLDEIIREMGTMPQRIVIRDPLSIRLYTASAIACMPQLRLRGEFAKIECWSFRRTNRGNGIGFIILYYTFHFYTVYMYNTL